MDTQSKPREDPAEDSKLQALRLIDQSGTHFLGEFCGLIYDLKPAVTTSLAEVNYVQTILQRTGIISNVYGRLIIREDLILKRLVQESTAAKECQFNTITDLDRFKEKCILYQGGNADRSGIFSMQLGFVLGFPLSAIRGFCRFKKVIHPAGITEETYCAPSIFYRSDAEWHKFKERLPTQDVELIRLVNQIRQTYKNLVAKIEPESEITQPRIDPKILFEEQRAFKESFLNDQKSSLVKFYILLGYNEEDARFLACGRLVQIVDSSGSYPVYTFMTWNYPDDSKGVKAVDCLDLQYQVGQRRVYD